MRFRRHVSDVAALQAVAQFPKVERLRWFNHGFMKAEERDGRLILSDLRMGAEPDYIFNFAVARRNSPAWRAIAVEQLDWPWNAAERLGAMWDRIWVEPAAPTR
jgi:inner membrane protein